MTPLPHTYHVGVEAQPSGYAMLSSAGIPDLRSAAPSDFDGPGDAWSPEHLLLAAVQSCFLITLRGIARASKVELLDVDVEASGTVNRENGVTRFTEIVLKPRLTLPTGVDRERALRILDKAEKNCLVAASLSTPVRLEPEILGADDARI